MSLDWWRIPSAPCAGTNAIIFPLVPSLSAHPNSVRHNETGPEQHSWGHLQNSWLQELLSLQPHSFYFVCYVLSGHYNVQQWLCQTTCHIFCTAGGWLTRKSNLPLTLCIPLLPLPAESCTLICWLPWDLLVMPLYSICHIVDDRWWLHIKYSEDFGPELGGKQSKTENLIGCVAWLPDSMLMFWRGDGFLQEWMQG